MRFDVYASDGTYLFDLEMQTVDKGDLPQRSRYYNCVLDIDQIYKEGDYVQLKPVFVIFICTFALSYGDRHRYTFCRYSTEDRNAALNDGTQIIMFSTKGTVDDLDEPMKQFLDCVDGKTAPGSGDAYIRQLDQSVKEARMNKEWRREYMNLEIMLKHAAEEAAEKAVAEAAPKIREEAVSEAAPKIRKEAVAVERKRTATRMLSEGELSDEQIIRYSGVTEKELEECKISNRHV